MPIPKGKAEEHAPRQLVRERVHGEIRSAILRGTLKPGERLDEASLREWLGVSATPIRQALHALVLEGLVESAPQSHTIVAAPRPDRLIANLQTVGVLLIGITSLTLPVLDAATRAGLAEQAGRIAEQLDQRDLQGSSTTAGAYFLTLIDRCPNDVLVDLTRRFGTSLGFHIFVTQQALGDDLDLVADAYRSLKQAMLDGDSARVHAATRQAFLVERPL